ncbi:OmpP1/FadL family transporter [Amaricoccus macauensis]|uniref:OmpP1/FadL family transporter n=1 Tax=Amaricoccus macauensis TaxID=57001 RepID=UPI003C7CF8D1
MRPITHAGLGLAAFVGSVGFASAAGIDRTLPSTTRILFEEGTYGEVGLTYTDPHQRGDDALLPQGFTGLPVPLPLAGETSDLFDPYWSLSGSFKSDINSRLSYALFLDQPFGANTDYGPDSFSPAVLSYEGTTATLDTWQVSGVIAYDIRPDLKIYGGVRALWTEASADVPFLFNYSVETGSDWGTGYLAGIAYSRPEIALRVALTYASEVTIRYDTEEWQAFDSTTEVTFPQSVDLEFQTGIAEDTLLFASIRWVEWSVFEMAPQAYVAEFREPLVNYEKDYTTYTLGIGRQITDKLAGSLSIIHEPSEGGSNLNTLGPYDGRTLGAAAMSYDVDERINITGGFAFGHLGSTSNGFETDFDDGSVWSAGLRLGYTF